MHRLPHTALRELADWLPLGDVARAAAVCRSLRDVMHLALRREDDARRTLRREHGRAMDLRSSQAAAACADCRLPGVRPYAELLAFLRGAPTVRIENSHGVEIDAVLDDGGVGWLSEHCEVTDGALRCVAASDLGVAVLAGYEASMLSSFVTQVLFGEEPLCADDRLALLTPGAVVRACWPDAGVTLYFVATPDDDALLARGTPVPVARCQLRWVLRPLGVRTCACAGACEWRCEAHLDVCLADPADRAASPAEDAGTGSAAPLEKAVESWADVAQRAAECGGEAEWTAAPRAMHAYAMAAGFPVAELEIEHNFAR